MIISFVKKTVSLLVASLFLFPVAIFQSLEQGEVDKQVQKDRIIALEQAYSAGEITKIDEQNFVLGDLDEAFENGVKFNEVSFFATHNSYQTRSAEAYCKIFDNLSTVTFGLVSEKTGDFESQTLTEQFNCGIRSIELDIETIKNGDEVSFVCLHKPCLDMGTTCYDLELTLKEIKMWSDYNPDHLPITIIIEPKKGFLPMKDMKAFNLDFALELDELLRKALGDKLYEPSDAIGEYESFADMRLADGWTELKDMRGKVAVLLHEADVTDEYIAVDESIKSQAMFPMLRYEDRDLSYASFLLMNDPAEALAHKDEVIEEKNLIVRTRADTFKEVTREDLEDSLASGAHLISTDYPIRTDLEDDDYRVSFGGTKTIKIK